MISKSLSTSRKYGRLTEVAGRRAEFCQALYPLLVAHADDFGRLAGDVYTVKHAIVPTSPRKEHDIASALAALHLVGLIEWYEVGEDKCIQITNFDAHQQGLHKRTRSMIPDPSGKFPEIPTEEKGTEEKGTKQKGTALRAVWKCQHIEQCSHRAMCKTKTDLGPEKYPVKGTA